MVSHKKNQKARLLAVNIHAILLISCVLFCPLQHTVMIVSPPSLSEIDVRRLCVLPGRLAFLFYGGKSSLFLF